MVKAGGFATRLMGLLAGVVVLSAVLTTGGVRALSIFEGRAAKAVKPIPAALVEPPLVQVVQAKRRMVHLSVTTEGIVKPSAESRLAAEAAGRIIGISPHLRAGEFVSVGEVLVELDSRDYELAVTRAEILLEQAKLRLDVQQQQAKVARKEWELVGEGEPSSLALHEPQLASARADILAAEAALKQAKLNLERTNVVAPFSGRVREKFVDLGQVLQPGSPVATIYSVETAEVRLPIPDAELAFLDIGLGKPTSSGPHVSLAADFAGREQRIDGRIVRTEGEIDARTGVVHAIAEILDPYGLSQRHGRAPFMVGMFVHAEIQGRSVMAIEIPATALREGSSVFVVDAEDRVELRQVDVIRAENDSVLVRAGLAEGDRVCVAVPDPMVSGMRVRIQKAASGAGAS